MSLNNNQNKNINESEKEKINEEKNINTDNEHVQNNDLNSNQNEKGNVTKNNKNLDNTENVLHNQNNILDKKEIILPEDNNLIIKKENNLNNNDLTTNIPNMNSIDLIKENYYMWDLDNIFVVFKMIKGGLYLVYPYFNSLICYDLMDEKIVIMIKNAHDYHIINLRHTYDKKSKRYKKYISCK